MSTIIRTWRLANGLTITVEDDTRNYYGGYCNVKLSIRCSVKVRPEYLESSKGTPYYDRVITELGDVAEYRREIVKAGVAGPTAAQIKEDLLGKFEENALPYFEREVFPERFIQKRFAEIAEECAKRDRADKHQRAGNHGRQDNGDGE